MFLTWAADRWWPFCQLLIGCLSPPSMSFTAHSVEMNLNSASFLPVDMMLTFVGRGCRGNIEGRVFLGSRVLAGQVAAASVASPVPRLLQLSAAWTVSHCSRGSNSRMLPLRYFSTNNFSWHSWGQISGKPWVSWDSAGCESSLVRSGSQPQGQGLFLEYCLSPKGSGDYMLLICS